MKAQIGDFIRVGEGLPPLRVVRLEADPADALAGDDLEDGSLIGDHEIGFERVLLAAEVA
jgi:hypothetical protein